MSLKLKVYSYSACGTCKKALKWLEINKIEFELLDIIKTPPSKENILKAIEQLGDRKFLFNTSGKSYRLLGSDAVKAMTDEDAIHALLLDGKLIKRPFLVDITGSVLVGFKESVSKDSLLP